MATRYRKHFRIFPGIRVNMNKPWRVNSLTLGKPGFLSTTVGKDGKKHLNIDLPFGYSWRKEFGKDSKAKKKKADGDGAETAEGSGAGSEKKRISGAEFTFIMLIGVAIGAYFF